MFGMGFFEILVVAVVAIIFLGPEKLPKALVDIAKFLKTLKRTIDDAKESLDREVNLSKIKEEALAYKNSLTQGVDNLTKDLDFKEMISLDEEEPKVKQEKDEMLPKENKKEQLSFKNYTLEQEKIDTKEQKEVVQNNEVTTIKDKNV
ncbi:twin arginine-targeting protein translocase TatB [Helicobacter valdiviensis]|uniref:Sec-independent protein translocase protein TatB homolog n=1 Tax=Helicobacter valdiviensis TaxID=1458358 RepID=A0A2W6MWF1_9HELI|nr:Sec-independent protein translocase protein TatB [Helicobacter valdiviensis]PZT48672.1 twin arginine-targeting protein translocase TatB [Helicobacter valdiviensis]